MFNQFDFKFDSYNTSQVTAGQVAGVLAKRQDGRFYTRGNPFKHEAFSKWAKNAGLPFATILEPFAGANGLIHHLENMGLCNKFRSYDIEPSSPEVEQLDTLANFPSNYDICITNPPWLARNVATRLGMDFPVCDYQDLYAHALSNCLANCDWVAALVPESFLRAGLFRSRLCDFISLTSSMFAETDHPVGLALFVPNSVKKTRVWSGKKNIGYLCQLESLRPKIKSNGVEVRFNEPDGNLGFIALDNTTSASIRFCSPGELKNYKIDQTRRSITRIHVDGKVEIDGLNKILNSFRQKTHDVLMTPFRGLRKDGMYRRRCDWNLARGIIHHYA